MIACADPMIWFDGQIVECNLIDNQLFNGGTTLYEVLRVMKGRPLFLTDHLDRLQQSIIKAQCNHGTLTMKDIGLAVEKVVQSNLLTEGRIEISLIFHNESRELIHFLVYSLPFSFPTDSNYQSGVKTMFYYAARQNPEVKAKDLSLREASEIIISKKNLYEVVLVDRYGRITEGSKTNIFFITGDNEIITAPAKMVLSGITRSKVIDLALKAGIEVQEKALMYNELDNVRGCFITGTSPKVLPVVQLEDYRFTTSHPLLRRMMNLYDELIADYLNNHSSNLIH